jgi:hypothetical protein
MRRAAAICSLAALLALAPALASAAPVDQLRELVRKGRAAQAYAEGKRMAATAADPEFAYYFGVAAIESGHAGEGVLALERYLAQFPDDDRARFDLGRGYYALGDPLRAREAFESVLGHQPTPDRRATIERFLDAIQSQSSRDAGASGAYVELGAGQDSNAVAATGATAPEAPLLDGLLPVPAGARRTAGLLLAGAGARYARPLAGALSLEAGARYQGRYRLDSFDRQLDQDALGGYGELDLIDGRNLYRARLSYSALTADDARYRNLAALGGEWRRQMDELNSLSLYAQYADLAYPASPATDSNLYALGAGWRRAFVQRYLPVVEVEALYAREKSAASPVRDELSRNLYSLRARVSASPWPRWALSGGVSYTGSRYDAPEPALSLVRGDDTYGLDAGLSYRWTRQLTLLADLLYADNRSNLAAYEYGRNLLTLRMRYDLP